MENGQSDTRPGLGLRQMINASGTMTSLGASIMVPEAVAAMAAIAPHFVEMSELHKKAGAVIAEATGARAAVISMVSASACIRPVAVWNI